MGYFIVAQFGPKEKLYRCTCLLVFEGLFLIFLLSFLHNTFHRVFHAIAISSEIGG